LLFLGLQPLSSAAVSNFQNDTQEVKITNSVGDLLQLTRQRGGRQFVGDPMTKLTNSLPKKLSGIKGSSTVLNATGGGGGGGGGLSSTGNNEFIGMKSAKYQNVHERPPRRVEISYLENELTQMVKTVMHPSSDDVIYQPHKEKMMLVQNQIFDELNIPRDNLGGAQVHHSHASAGNEQQHQSHHRLDEPWLDGIVKSECLKDLCDEVGLRLTDMLSVSSAELGNVLRKLRYTYDQSFLQLLSSWKELRCQYVIIYHELQDATHTIEVLTEKINERDFNIREQIDEEIDEIKKDFEYDREQDKEKIRQQEIQMDQMTSTLKNLNAIFKTMQADVDAARAADTYARCSRLEREVAELESQILKAEKLRKELDEEKEKNFSLENLKTQQNVEIEALRAQVSRRDGTIGELMERESLRNAEIEKLTRMAAQRQENDEDLDLDPVATSVLCIKCKKSLDDITSIREAILGNNKSGKGQKLACQSYRILLPNNKGKKPFRKTVWLKACMRSILTSKMIETLAVIPIGENVTPFPSFVYSWFQPSLEFSTEHHSILHSYNQQADENRWGFYYGIKTLTKDNAEAKLFWSLLDESQGEDGLIFLCHCLSVVISIGGPSLWKQFGSTMNYSCLSIHDDMLSNVNDHNTPSTIWLDLETAYSAIRIILVRALESQIAETVDAIELLKCVPDIPNPLVSGNSDGENGEEGVENPTSSAEEKSGKEEEEDEEDESAGGGADIPATHIDLFIWLRVMMQRFQDEQCHRHAAIRLMFDTASMGALIPSTAKGSPRSNNHKSNGQDDSIHQAYDSENPQVYFPQFTAVVRTLYPHMSQAEIAELYASCYIEGDGRVTATVFTEIAGRRHLFSKSLKLGPLPLLAYDAVDSIDGPPVPGSPPLMDFHFDSNQSTRLRSQIGSLVHQRFALLQPEIEVLAKKLPGKWRAMIVDACESVKSALQEYFVIMKAKKRSSLVVNNTNNNTSTASLPLTSPDGSMTAKMRSGSADGTALGHNSKSADKYIDGLQPFIQYHRLLAMVIMVKSFNENSILPISFILDGEGTHHRPQTPSLSPHPSPTPLDTTMVQLNTISLKKVEKVLSCLEDSIFTHSIEHNAQQKYKRFEKFRFSFFARKVQNAFRLFLTKDSSIPRALRYIIRPGYLGGGGGGGGQLLDAQQGGSVGTGGGNLLKSRRVYLEPWILQLLVSNIYAYKLSYDFKAMKISQPHISLPQATSALLLMFFSSLDLVERVMHDLCLGIQTYMHGCPRLRLFASFLGFGEVEEPTSQMLTEEILLTSYLELLALIHKEISYKQNLKYSSVVPILFPVTEDPFTRTDKRDVWSLPLTTLTRALGQWSMSFKGLKGDIWENALTRIKRNKEGLTEVDDFLWVIMMTLAKTLTNRQRKCEDQAKSYTLREAKIREYKLSETAARGGGGGNMKPGSRAASASAGGGVTPSSTGFVTRTASGILADHALEEQKLFQMKFSHCVSITSLQNSVNLIHGKNFTLTENTNSDPDASATFETDLQKCCASFIPIYSQHRHGSYKVYTQLLQQCVIWDTCSGGCALLDERGEGTETELSIPPGVGEQHSTTTEPIEPETQFINHRSSLIICAAVPAILSLRYFSFWWNTQKDLVTNEVKEIEVRELSLSLDLCFFVSLTHSRGIWQTVSKQ
jgi:hypothetical protein